MQTTSSNPQQRNSNEPHTSALEMLRSALAATEAMGELFPPIKGVVHTIRLVVEPLAQMSTDTESIETLSRYISRLGEMANSPSTERMKSSQTMASRLNRFEGEVAEIAKHVKTLKRRSRLTLGMQSDNTDIQIQKLIDSLSWALNCFNAETTLDTNISVQDLRAVVAEQHGEMKVQLDRIENNQRSNISVSKDNYGLLLKHATPARFDYNNNRSACQSETRLETLAVIYHWIDPEHPLLSSYPLDLIQSTTSARVFWLNGLAGTGKSTLAQTVAEQCDRDKRLGASFFCSRDSHECNSVKSIFPTIAYQLGLVHPKFQEEVLNILRGDPEVQECAIVRQLQRLIVEPLQLVKAKSDFPALVIVIDALDECRDELATKEILSSLSFHISNLAPLRFFITSRPVQNITSGFKDKQLSRETQHIALHNIPVPLTNRDIGLYLDNKLRSIADSYDIDSTNWLAKDVMERLVQLSNGLFIFAATAIKFVEDKNASSPKEQLGLLLGYNYTASSSSPYRYLDVLYLQVLRAAFPNLDERGSTKLKLILGSLVLTRDLFQPDSLERLLKLPSDTVRPTLHHLQSIVILPQSNTEATRLIHPSFHDFLIDSSRCTDFNLNVNPKVQHTILAMRCLESLGTLRKDICGIGDFSKLNADVPDLEARVLAAIPTHLRYACRHWAFHLSAGEVESSIMKELETFCNNHLLHWLEALSLLGRLDSAVESLELVREKLERLPLPDKFAHLRSLIMDCEHVVRQMAPGLRLSYSQAYSGVIPFCPSNCAFREQYASQAHNVVSLASGIQQSWSPCVSVLEGHNGIVRSVAVSPNSKQIVSGSQDKTVRLWDLSTGTHLHTLTDHMAEVTSVSFSPSGKQMISASLDSTVICWDVTTGANLITWKEHTKSVRAVAYSPDGLAVASGSDDCLVIVRDIGSDQNSPMVLRGHRAGVSSVAFFHSKFPRRVASGGDDGNCFIWDCATKTQQSINPSGIRVSAVAVSPDDQILACGYADSGIKLWDTVSLELLHELKRHQSHIWSIDFSIDNRVVASGSWDHMIKLWSTHDGSLIRSLVGHPDQVTSVQFVPNSLLLCSGSADNSVRLWEYSRKSSDTHSPSFWRAHFSWKGRESQSVTWHASSGQYESLEGHHSSVVRAIAFSPDGEMLATGSWDGTARLWEVESGRFLKSLLGHKDLISFLAFSSDGNLLLSCGHSDNTIRVWDVKKRRSIGILEGHSAGVWMARFSGNGKQVISCSDDGTVRQWDITISKAPQAASKMLYKGTGPVYAVAISPNDQLAAFGSLDLQAPGARAGFPRLRLMISQSRTLVWSSTCTSRVTSLAFSSDSTRLLSSLGHGSVMLWDCPTNLALDDGNRPVPLAVFDAHSVVEHVAFSKDERAIITDASYHPILERDHLPRCVSSMTASAPPAAAYFFLDNWIWQATPEAKRICWVPVIYRHVRTRPVLYRGNMAIFGDRIAFGTENGLVVIVKLSV